MASSAPLLLFLCSLLLFSRSSFSSAATLRPHALLLPVTKDAATLQYLARVRQRTPSVDVALVVDLGGRFLWVDCDSGFISSTRRHIPCDSPQCAMSNSGMCSDNVCGLLPGNPFIETSTGGSLESDVLSVLSTDGYTSGPLVSVSSFLFTCAPTFLLRGLARGANGMAGLGRNKVGMPSLLSAAFHLPRKFAICLPSYAGTGAIFFGDGPYEFLGTYNPDIAQYLTYTPLFVNPVSTAGASFGNEKSAEYFIGVTAIGVGEKAVPVDAKLLAIGKDGVGGTKISTATPYTTLHTSIYKAVVGAFASALAEVPRMPPVAPFGLCFEAAKLGSTRVGPAVPAVYLVLQGEGVNWTMWGANTMVEAGAGGKALCLGFVDGGRKPTTSIVIGGHQLEDNLLQFDLRRSRLGFSSSLSFYQTTCSNFNFTSMPL